VHASRGRWGKGFLLSKEVKGEFIDVGKQFSGSLIHRLKEFIPYKHIGPVSEGEPF